jgi:hypothetical protein
VVKYTFLQVVVRLKFNIMRNTNIESKIVHAVWSSVSAINQQVLLQLDDQDLIQQIMRQIDKSSTLSSEDRQNLIGYIRSKMMLIRDMAGS